MPSPDPEVFRLAERYRLGLRDTPHRGIAGERLGKGTGASLEFQDRRDYQPGDDVRHVDWRAFARTDQFLVRMYREEILPRVDVVADISASMAVDEEKAQCAVDLCALVLAVARGSGFAARLVLAGDRPEIVDLEHLERHGLSFTSDLALPLALDRALPLLRAGTIRILLSDFLAPVDAASLVRPFAARAGGFVLLQLLGREDLTPPAGSALRLTDSETNETLDLVLDPPALTHYHTRLDRLQRSLETESRRAAGRFLTLPAQTPLADLCRSTLTRDSILVLA
jgi:uncharacterized protein (DUF58 family)